jgi:RNA polymerase sigma factor (sigma-70 family)
MRYDQTITLYQPMLQTIAYNLVRCKADAEDIVQETFLKWLSIGPQKIENVKAYLIKAVTNNCLSHLTSLKKKKEELFNNANITEIINRFKETNLAHLDLEVHLSAAWKVLQSKLEPLERAVYVLKEVFDFDYETLQETLNKKKDHCRQLFSRARKKIQDSNLKNLNFSPSALPESFYKACHLGNAAEFIAELKKELASKKE